MADRVLPQFPPRLSQRAARALEQLGVTPLTGHRVVDITAESVTLEPSSRTTEHVRRRERSIWAAGVVASELAGRLAAEAGAELDRAGRVAVGPELTAARASRGDRARRHGAGARRRRKAGPAARARTGRDAAGALRRPRGPRAPAGARAGAVPLPRQGQPGDDRPRQGRSGHQGPAAQRVHRLADLAASSTSST